MAIFILTVFAVLAVGSIVRPQWALALLLLMYPLEQAMQGSVYYLRSHVSMTNFAVAAIVFASTLLGFARGTINLSGYFNRIWVLVACAYLYSLFSVLWTPSRGTAFILLDAGYPYVGMYIVVAPLFVQRLSEWRNVLMITTIFGLLIAVAILFTPDFTLKGGRLGFDFGGGEKSRSSPLAIGELGGFLMLSGALFVVEGRKNWMLALRIAALIAGTVLSIYSGSRGQFIFAALLAIVFFPISRPIRDLRQFVFFAAAAIGFMVVIAVVLSILLGDQDVVARWFSGAKTEDALEVRSANATELLHAYARSPSSWLTGLGLNAFTSITGSAHEPYTHSMFVDVLAEMGLVAFAFLCYWLWTVARQSIELVKGCTQFADDRSAAALLVALCCYQILLMNKQGELWTSEHTVVYFLLLAKIAADTINFGGDSVDDVEHDGEGPVAEGQAD